MKKFTRRQPLCRTTGGCFVIQHNFRSGRKNLLIVSGPFGVFWLFLMVFWSGSNTQMSRLLALVGGRKMPSNEPGPTICPPGGDHFVALGCCYQRYTQRTLCASGKKIAMDFPWLVLTRSTFPWTRIAFLCNPKRIKSAQFYLPLDIVPKVSRNYSQTTKWIKMFGILT